LPSGVRAAGHNPQSGVERLTTGNEPEQRPRGLTVSQNLNQPGAIPGEGLRLPATNTCVSTSRPDAFTRLSTSEPAAGTCPAIVPVQQNKSTIVRR
ncbi:TPA: hypothetical protein ACIYP6_004846, partial [Escherichia coli]